MAENRRKTAFREHIWAYLRPITGKVRKLGQGRAEIVTESGLRVPVVEAHRNVRAQLRMRFGPAREQLLGDPQLAVVQPRDLRLVGVTAPHPQQVGFPLSGAPVFKVFLDS